MTAGDTEISDNNIIVHGHRHSSVARWLAQWHIANYILFFSANRFSTFFTLHGNIHFIFFCAVRSWWDDLFAAINIASEWWGDENKLCRFYCDTSKQVCKHVRRTSDPLFIIPYELKSITMAVNTKIYYTQLILISFWCHRRHGRYHSDTGSNIWRVEGFIAFLCECGGSGQMAMRLVNTITYTHTWAWHGQSNHQIWPLCVCVLE